MVEKNITQKAVEGIKKGNERGAREAMLEDLFYDFHRSRVQVYKMNFVRGIFFGLGSVLGGTVIVALVIWTLSFFVDVPGIGESVKQIQQTVQSVKK